MAAPPAHLPEHCRAEARDFREEVDAELVLRLLPFWTERAPDARHGGFHGQIDADGTPRVDAPKATLLTARILWTFARAHRHRPDAGHLELATRARDYLLERMWDPRGGGLFFSVDSEGRPHDTRKHVYVQAFGIYALSEFARATGDEEALTRALALLALVERHAHDGTSGGYVNAFARDWTPLADMRLNPRFDAMATKTMNTHLHLVEALTNLLALRPDAPVHEALRELVALLTDRMFDATTGHFMLDFDSDWTRRSRVVSFGHDIEASWLLTEAAQAIADPRLIARARHVALAAADAVLRDGVDLDGGVLYEIGPEGITGSKDWWVQAEAVVGLLNAFEQSGDERHWRAALNAWRFIRRHVLAPWPGEWRWRVARDGTPAVMPFAGGWKCPYHNGRMCVEVVTRLDRMRS